jgi:AcrR family transcriptional regulator
MRAGLTVERLAEAGAKLADDVGFDAVTPTALAKLFDVKVASLYSHIANANDLKTRVALLALERLADRVAEAVAGRSGRDALAALANVHRNFAREHPGLFVAARHPLDAGLAARSGGARIAALTRSALQGYRLDKVAEVHAIRLLGSVMLGFSTLELAGSFDHSQPSPELSWQAAVDALHPMLCQLSRDAA